MWIMPQDKFMNGTVWLVVKSGPHWNLSIQLLWKGGSMTLLALFAFVSDILQLVAKEKQTFLSGYYSIA